MQALQKIKILVGIPYHERKRYCLNHLFDKVASLKSKYQFDIVLRWDRGRYGSKDCVKKQREFFRLLAISRDYSHLYFLGADTIPPDNVLDILVECNKDIVGGVYYNRYQPERAIAWKDNDKDQLFLKSQQLVEVDGMGMDCVLISRKVLEKISFMDWRVNDDDYPFYDKAKSLGYKIYLHTGVVCRHYLTSDKYV